MRKSGRIVTLFCSVAIGVSVFANPAHAEFETKKCKQLAAAWKKAHPHATLEGRLAEAESLALNHSCNFEKDLTKL
jgi:hypothetical protein